jgi:hypothetical protein
MDPITLSAIIAGGTQLANTGSQLFTNAKNRKNALEDWNRMNAYNSPAEQMKRYKEAGLNPNLIYGQTNTAAPVRSTDYVAPELKADALDMMGKAVNIKRDKVQTQVQQQAIQNQAEDLATKQLINEGLRIKNRILANSEGAQTDSYSIKNRLGQQQYQNLLNGAKLQEQQYNYREAMNPKDLANKDVQNTILQKTFQKLSTEQEFTRKNLQLGYDTGVQAKKNMMQQYEIGKVMKTNLQRMTDKIGADINMSNTQQQVLYGNYLKGLRQDLSEITDDTNYVDKIIDIAQSLLPFKFPKAPQTFINKR